jgi:hypothetical protein
MKHFVKLAIVFHKTFYVYETKCTTLMCFVCMCLNVRNFSDFEVEKITKD